MHEIDRAAVIEQLASLLADTLQLGRNHKALTEETRLLGSIPELDSMAVVSVITAIEEHFGFTVEDDEISADAFANLRSLADFVEGKIRS